MCVSDAPATMACMMRKQKQQGGGEKLGQEPDVSFDLRTRNQAASEMPDVELRKPRLHRDLQPKVERWKKKLLQERPSILKDTQTDGMRRPVWKPKYQSHQQDSCAERTLVVGMQMYCLWGGEHSGYLIGHAVSLSDLAALLPSHLQTRNSYKYHFCSDSPQYWEYNAQRDASCPGCRHNHGLALCSTTLPTRHYEDNSEANGQAVFRPKRDVGSGFR